MAFVDQFNDAKENFKVNLLKSQKILSVTKGDDVLVAVNKSYQTAKRTFNGIGKSDSQNKKKEVFDEFSKKLAIFFNSPFEDKGWENFSEKLQEWRNFLIDGFGKINCNMTVGQAQKIVNMTFKFLYCFDDVGDEYDEYFKYCHMPLDDEILSWCKQAGVKVYNIKKEPIELPEQWSDKIDEDLYKYIQFAICCYLNDPENLRFESIELDKSCFKSEFVIWQYMKEKESLNTILKSLGNFNIKHLSCIDKKYISAASKNVDNIKAMICKLNDWIK